MGRKPVAVGYALTTSGLPDPADFLQGYAPKSISNL